MGFLKSAQSAVQSSSWGDLQDVLNGVARDQTFNLKELKTFMGLLKDLDPETDPQIILCLEDLVYSWAQNMQSRDKEMAIFLQYADHFVELLQSEDEFVKAGKAMERLHIHLLEEGGYLFPENVIPDLFYVRAAEYYLKGESMMADQVMGKVRNRIRKSDGQIWIRYKSCQSRLMDSQRKYGGASYAYLGTLRDADSLGITLDDEAKIMTVQNASVCAILDKHSPSRTAILKDLSVMPEFNQMVAPVRDMLRKMLNKEIVTPQDKSRFAGCIGDHHKALEADGRTIVENSIIRHNVSVVSSIYKHVSLQTMAEILGMRNEQDAENVITEMIIGENLRAIIDGVGKHVEFNPGKSLLEDWEEQIIEFCNELDTLCGDIDRVRTES